MQFKAAIPGVTKAVLWGDPTKGPYGAITRFTKGTKNGWHTHSNDLKIVVISGAFLYDNGSGEKRLGPGSYLYEPGGLKHTSAASADSDLMFFEEGSGPFDIKMAK
jgi:quercetin dioxygenase-like cupin family protein